MPKLRGGARPGAGRPRRPRKPPGRPPHVPTEQSRRFVGALVTILYLNHERVAAVMGLNPKTLRKHYHDELHRAKLEVDIAVGQTYAAIPAGGHRYRRTGSGPSNGAQTNGGCWVSERRRVPKRKLPNYFGRKALLNRHTLSATAVGVAFGGRGRHERPA